MGKTATKDIIPAEEFDLFALEGWLKPDELQMVLGGEVDSAEATKRIAARILEAKSKEEAFGGGEVVHARDVLSTPLKVTGFSLNRSTFDEGEGAPFYAVMDAIELESGETLKITAGSINVLVGLLKARNEGWFPLDVRIEQSTRPTPSGYYPQRLELV